MALVWGCEEAPRLRPIDFDTDKYKCIRIGISEDDIPTGVFMSEEANPPHYKVACGSSELFFTCLDKAYECFENIVSSKNNNGRRNKR